ncbi:MAG: ribonuclease D [Acidimicrobiia bacterium]|nr:ribonuclease D [Acidimicrobiia bacterium]
MSFEWVDSEKALDDVIDSVLTGSRYAIDTEFHREKTYYPKLALVQIRWGTQTALIDPLAVDPRRLGRLFSSEILAVFHAAQQDLEVLRHASSESPRNIFDCQVAAGFVGFSTPSLATLVQAVKKTSLSKGDRLTDWLRRPLTDQQCAYAADDVVHLFDLHDELTKQLIEFGRVEWVNDACAELVGRPTGPQDPSDAWLRLKEARALKGSSRGVAQALAKWREERAMRSDLPPRRVMSDMALIGIAQRIPKSVEELANTRGVDDRHLSAEYCKEIMTAVREGAKKAVVLPIVENDDVDKIARPALTLITAWVGELARKHKIDATLLATRSDITAFLRQSPNARLREGWRAALVGDDLTRILNGEVGLSVDRDGHLKLVSSATS